MTDVFHSRGERDSLRFVTRGASSHVYALSGDEVVKLFRPGVSDEMIEREAQASRRAAELGMAAVAPVRAVIMEGARGLVYPRVKGATLLMAMRRQPWRSGAIIDAMARLQVRMHEAPATGGLRRLKDVLRTDIVHGPASKAVKDAALARLETMPDGRQLLHGDFHIENIMMDGRDLKVIDWSKAALGDPAADMARTEMLMRFGDGPEDPLTALSRDWAARRWRATYLRESGMDGRQVGSWRALVAIAWLRARKPVRQRAFHAYLDGALREAGLAG
ncbi:phosphotransferase family protein [Sphingobium baderi]|uniref:phosphotransferase family protein n=1 Tax=Sphingobium baderi TaxID=1332080 RepID=UPI002B4167B7|nr:aminoglycoside phosphotransferase family protein [Sphingobium baderi]WRD76621.1 aminoglycoside phosphotransferase family protein [Sphingobium baderi]